MNGIVTGGEILPADIQLLTSWGQRACLSSALHATWGIWPLARTAGVQWEWRAGWRKAARGSPGAEDSQNKNKKNHSGEVKLLCILIFSGLTVEMCHMLHFPFVRFVFCIILSGCSCSGYVSQCVSVVCRTVENGPREIMFVVFPL